MTAVQLKSVRIILGYILVFYSIVQFYLMRAKWSMPAIPVYFLGLLGHFVLTVATLPCNHSMHAQFVLVAPVRPTRALVHALHLPFF